MQLTLQEEQDWRERVHRMYAEARALGVAASNENERFREYLKTKYVPQAHVFE